LPNEPPIMITRPVSILFFPEFGADAVPFAPPQATTKEMGGTATLIGDPPNVMIGSATGLNFMDFIFNLMPVILVMIGVNLGIIYLIFHKRMRVSNERMARIREFDDRQLITDRPLMQKSVFILLAMVFSFLCQGLLHLQAATIALGFAIIMLLFTKPPSLSRILAEDIEWSSIFFFIGLFIAVGGLVQTKFINLMAVQVMNLTNGNLRLTSDIIVWASGILSALIDNIPFVATMIPLIKDIGQSLGSNGAQLVKPLWWALSLGACLGGNGTLVGASANIVSAGIANNSGYKVSFWGFTKYGALLTLVNLAIAMAYMRLRYF